MSTMDRRTLLRLVGASALSVPVLSAIAACAPQASTPNTDNGNADLKNIRFTAWSLNEEASKPVVQGMLDAWAGKSGGTVTTGVWPFNEYLNQLTLQIRGGQAVGAVQLSIDWLAQLATFAQFEDLSSVAGKGGYSDAALKAGQVNGKQLALPWTIGSLGMLANSDLLNRAGVTSAPTTIAEFEQALIKLKALDVVPYAGMTKVAQLGGDITTWMRVFGSPIVDNSGKIVIGDEASVEAVTWYKSLYDRKLIAADVDRFDARALFSKGKAAIYDDAIVGKSAVLTGAADPTLASKLMPMARPVKNSGATPVHTLWGHVIAVFKGDGSRTAADLASYMTSDSAATDALFGKLSLPPTTTAALGSAAVKQDTYTTQWTERITKTAAPSPIWPFAKAAQMNTELANRVQSVLIGQATPAEALKAAAEAMNKLTS